MILDLFVTHWTEPWEVGRKMFQMLACQQMVDWSKVRITIVHDGTEAFPAECLTGLPFTVKQVTIPHCGIAGARNWCIKHSDADWIKWCDFDDMFFNAYALKQIVNVLDTDNFDLLWFDLLCNDRERIYLRTERNPVFVHDKVFRRQFLIDHQITFNEDLTWCEDSAFLAVIEMEIDHQRIGRIKCDYPIYLYIARDGSLCNRPEIRFANLQSFFQRHCYVADEFLKRSMMDQYYTMCMRVMCDSYYTLCLAPGITEDKSEHERRVWKWYDEHKEQIHKCRPEMIEMVIEAVNKECFDGGEITWEAVSKWIESHERGEV